MTTSNHKGFKATIDSLADSAAFDLPLVAKVDNGASLLAQSIKYDSMPIQVSNFESVMEDDNMLDTPLRYWGVPTEIKTELLPVMAFNHNLLPSMLHDYVVDEAGRMSANPDYIAVSLIASLCSVLGTRIGIRPKALDSWEIVPNLWGCVIGPPSNLKTPAIGAGMKYLELLVNDARKSHALEMKKYSISTMMHEAKENGLKTHLKQAGKSTEDSNIEAIAKQLQALQEDMPDSPILKRYKTNDGSPEAIAVLEATNPNGILVYYDELAGLFATLDQDGNEAGRAFYLAGWDGMGSIEIDRISRPGIYVERHCLSVFGGIQPDKMVQYLEPCLTALGNDGLFQRLQLMVYPDALKWSYCDKNPNTQLQHEVYALFKKIDGLTNLDLVQMGACSDGADSRPYFRYSEDAQELFKQWTTKLHCEILLNEEHSIMQQHFAKYDKLMPALSLLFHVIECLESGKTGNVSLEAAQYAVAWCEYLETHARRIYHLVLDSKTIAAATLAQKITQLAKKQACKTYESQHDWIKHGFTARHVQQKGWKGLTNVQAIQNALEMLVDEHWLQADEVQPTAKGGRPSKRYWINPAVYS